MKLKDENWNERRRGIILKCLECGGDIKTYVSLAPTKKFCSLKCRNENYAKRRGAQCGFYGHSHKEETKVFVANKWKIEGHKPPLRTGCIPWNKGKRIFYNRGEQNVMRRPEVRLLASKKQKGNLGNNWRGGRTERNKIERHGVEFKMWRETIFKRDDWTCQVCKKRGGVLHPHHIKFFAEYPTLRFDISNGITLCRDCHQTMHQKTKLSAI